MESIIVASTTLHMALFFLYGVKINRNLNMFLMVINWERPPRNGIRSLPDFSDPWILVPSDEILSHIISEIIRNQIRKRHWRPSGYYTSAQKCCKSWYGSIRKKFFNICLIDIYLIANSDGTFMTWTMIVYLYACFLT